MQQVVSEAWTRICRDLPWIFSLKVNENYIRRDRNARCCNLISAAYPSMCDADFTGTRCIVLQGLTYFYDGSTIAVDAQLLENIDKRITRYFLGGSRLQKLPVQNPGIFKKNIGVERQETRINAASQGG